MSFLAPVAFLLGTLAAAIVTGLHLLTTHRPPRAMLPTARFIPMVEARAVAWARRPTDILLLVLRGLAVLLVGAAFARPVLDAPGPRVRSVVLLDLSGAVADPEAAAARARESMGEGSALVVFDTAARVVSLDSLDAVVGALGATRPARATLSPALAAARGVAGEVARGADSVRLVIVSPLAEGGADAATAALRTAWPGRAEVVRVPGVADTARGPAPELMTSLADDPMRAALARASASRGAHAVRVVRHALSTADSAWAREPAHLLLHWPVPEGSATADAVSVAGPGGVTLVAPLVRGAVPPHSLVLARWRDGSAAVTEAPTGAGCIRSVGVGVPVAGDLVLRAPFTAFLESMLVPCAGRRGAPVSDAVALSLAGTGTLAPARLLAREAGLDARLPAWLLALALVALSVEWFVRRRATV